jgi:hypothetical protein
MSTLRFWIVTGLQQEYARAPQAPQTEFPVFARLAVRAREVVV